MKTERTSRKKVANRAALAAPRHDVAGIDVGSQHHWVCGPPRADGEPNVVSFGTTTSELEALVEWLKTQGVRSVSMESTHVYWIPLFELLETHGIEAVLVNARQLHNVPGRKTDVLDCQWIQTLHSHGLLRASFRPSDAIVRVRALQRQHAQFVEQRTRCIQWMQKALDQMNVQVHRAVSDLTGTTGMAMLRAIVGGERDPARLAQFRDKRCRKSEAQIAEHLRGNWRNDHLFNLGAALQMYDTIEKTLALYEKEMLQQLQSLTPPERRDDQIPPHPNPTKENNLRRRDGQPMRTILWRFSGTDLTRIDGVSTTAARIILTEVGPNLSTFPSESHFVSWLRLCPRTAVSGGKPLKKRRNALGANRIAGVLRMAALTLHRSKTALGASFRRIARYKGASVAVFATARKLAQLVYRMLRYGQDYTDIGEALYERIFLDRRLKGLTDGAKSLGYSLVPATS